MILFDYKLLNSLNSETYGWQGHFVERDEMPFLFTFLLGLKANPPGSVPHGSFGFKRKTPLTA
jgi:hypothetical protein